MNGEPEHDWTDETDGSHSAIPLHAAITGKSFHVFIPYILVYYIEDLSHFRALTRKIYVMFELKQLISGDLPFYALFHFAQLITLAVLISEHFTGLHQLWFSCGHAATPLSNRGNSSSHIQ